MPDKITLALSTAVAPAKKFLVDGEEYTLYGLEHLDSDVENTVMALFARHVSVAMDLENATSVAKGEGHAARLKKLQDMIIEKMTDVPKDIIEKLPMGQKAKLFEAIRDELQDEDDVAVTQPESDQAKAEAAAVATQEL